MVLEGRGRPAPLCSACPLPSCTYGARTAVGLQALSAAAALELWFWVEGDVRPGVGLGPVEVLHSSGPGLWAGWSGLGGSSPRQVRPLQGAAVHGGLGKSQPWGELLRRGALGPRWPGRSPSPGQRLACHRARTPPAWPYNTSSAFLFSPAFCLFASTSWFLYSPSDS